jgi:hypothetical protein
MCISHLTEQEGGGAFSCFAVSILPPIEELNTKKSYFWLPRNLSNHMDRQAPSGDTVLVNIREMTGPNTSLVAGGGEVKTTETKYIGPVATCHPVLAFG